jgi:signal transduction histidine kinase
VPGGRGHSLLFRIAGALIAVSLLTVGAVAFLLFEEFRGSNDRMRDRTLAGEVRIIERFLAPLAAGGDAAGVPRDLLHSLHGQAVLYTVVDGDGALVAASPGLTEPLYGISQGRTRDYFIVPQPDGQRPYYGITRRVGSLGRDLWIQVASNDLEMYGDTVIDEFLDDLAWLWIPFVFTLVGVNLLVIYHGLRPLRRVSACAAAIGPDSISVRLPEGGVPREIRPLVDAVNLALARLEDGYDAQRAFIADAAHELRTPLAVLEAHLAALGDAGAPLRHDVMAMTRLVNQLLDMARLDALRVPAAGVVDLRQLAVDVATHMAPLAIRHRRQMAVSGAQHAIPVRGDYDILFRAVRNLVENALTQTPPGGTVSLLVEVAEDGARGPVLRVADQGPGIPEDRRALVFQRFWRGDRIRAGDARAGDSGAGLGLSIVARTVAAHGGRVNVDDAPGGGAVFSIHLPHLDGDGRTAPDGTGGEAVALAGL